MKLIPRSGTLLRVRIAHGLSTGGPQMPGPVRRMAPKPRRCTSISPPILNEPDSLASSFSIIDPCYKCLRSLLSLGKCGHHVLIAARLRNCCLPGGYRHMVRIRAPTSAWVRDDAERALLALSSTTARRMTILNLAGTGCAKHRHGDRRLPLADAQRTGGAR